MPEAARANGSKSFGDESTPGLDAAIGDDASHPEATGRVVMTAAGRGGGGREMPAGTGES